MITVPEKVKDALREGNLRKNYRLIVKTVTKVWNDALIANIPTDSYYTVIEWPNNYVVKNPTNNRIILYIYNGSAEAIGLAPGDEWDKVNTNGISDGTQLQASAVGLTLVSRDDFHEETSVDFTITNDNLVKESVKLDERMCSSDQLEFGLCEGSSLEFQYFDFPNIRGKQIEAHIDVEYEDGWYDIPLGFFDVEQCSTQFSTGIIKVTAVNKLKSDYLDANAKEYILSLQGDTYNPDEITLKTIQDTLLKSYAITQRETRTPQYMPGGIGDETIEKFTFKINGSSTNYYPYMDIMLKVYNLQDTDYIQCVIDEYIAMLAKEYRELWEVVQAQVQNPDVFWPKYLNGTGYKKAFGIRVVFPELDPSQYKAVYVYNSSQITNWPSVYEIKADIKKLVGLYGVTTVVFGLPTSFGRCTSSSGGTYTWMWLTHDEFPTDPQLYIVDSDSIDTLSIPKSTLNDVTLRELISANYEMHCQFGKLDRETNLFSGVDLNHSRLYPADDLYPADTLYPDGSAEGSFRSQYSKLWTDEVGEQSFRDLYITYRTLNADNKEEEVTRKYTVNSDGTTDYVMDSNWLLKNLTWTGAQIDTLGASLVDKLKPVRWFPFEMWAAGLPYLETGDELEIITKSGTYTSYILQRQLQGIHNLQDTYINGQLDIF